MDKTRIKLLIIDDEPTLAGGIQEALQREGYVVDAAHNANAARVALANTLYNLVLTDVKLPDGTGHDLLMFIREKSRDTVVMVMTAFGTVENAVQAMKHGAYDYLAKPLDMQRLRASVLKALEFQAIVAENHELRLRLKKRSKPSLLVGNSEALQSILRLADEVAQTDVTVLIEGESGTGKELIARLIHTRSARAEKPYIYTNCAALPEQLLEAELFGHMKGAFTGAVTTKEGRFQLADGGTLFLDEIGDLSPKGQGDLLRVLEDGTFRMVGGTKLCRVNVRVLAATNKKLEQAMKTGAFREDLYYRLQIVPITMPPLRDRAEDIPLLLDHFLNHFTSKHKRGSKRMSAAAIQVCQRYPWPGNVRQLRSTMERIVLTCPNAAIEVGHLPDTLRAHDVNATTFTIRPGTSLAEVEKLLIRQTLTHVTSNRDGAAEVLGISRRTLQYKLKEYGLIDDAAEKRPAS